MKFKGNLKAKRTQKITSKEPTNIFDFNRPSKVIDFNKLIKTSPIPSSQPLKIIDFNKMILTQNKNKSFEINEIKNPVKRKKMNKVKFVDFDEILFKNVKEGNVKEVDGKEVGSKVKAREVEDKVEGDKGIKKDTKVDVKDKVEEDKNEKDKLDTKKIEVKEDIPTHTINPIPPISQPLPPISQPLPIPQPFRNHKPIRNHKNFVNRVLSSLEEGSSITDLIKIYIKEKKRTSKSLYLHNLGEKIDKNSILIEDIDLNKEIQRLDKQIENIEIQDKLWTKIREASFKDNSFYYKNEENDKDNNLNNLFCISKNQIDLKIKEKINKLNFIKESLNLNVKKIKSKVQEEEEKIFKLTENENELDTMVLLKAITRS